MSLSAGSEIAHFVDRDGVINRRRAGGYVTCVEEFELLPGAVDALRVLSTLGRVIVVTNQRGIALGKFDSAELDRINGYMVDLILNGGGRIDDVMVCPHDVADQCDCRKPLPGLLLRGISRYPEICLEGSAMIGDSESDMEASYRADRRIRRIFIGLPSFSLSASPWAPCASYASLSDYVVSLPLVDGRG